MKKLTTVLMTMAALAMSAAGAENVVDVKVIHTRWLQFEPVLANVSVKNLMDDLIIFGGDPKDERAATVSFVITKGPTEWVDRKKKGNAAGSLRVLPGDRREAQVDLTQWFDLTVMGTYLLTAVVEYGGQKFTSETARFEVENGLPIGSLKQTFSGGTPDRLFGLRYMSRDGFERLFLRVDEIDTGVNFGTFELGPLVRVRRPQISMETAGLVVVSHQSASDRFTRSTFKADSKGVSFVDQTYWHEDGRPYGGTPKAKEKSSD
jgi:hypothetical protein